MKGASQEAAGVHLFQGPAIISGTGRLQEDGMQAPAPTSPGLELAPHWALVSTCLAPGSFTWESVPSLRGERTTFWGPCLLQLILGCLGSLLSLGRDSPAQGQNVWSWAVSHCWSKSGNQSLLEPPGV